MSATKTWTELDLSEPIWDHFHLVAPLLLIGTREPDGTAGFSPKHMVSPMGWDNYFGFVCTPTHSTYRNILRTEVFTINAPRPNQLALASMAASCREESGEKPAAGALPSFPALKIDAPCLLDSYFILECRLFKMVEDIGQNTLIIGKVEVARVHKDGMRDGDGPVCQLKEHPLLAFVAPDRFTTISTSFAFPYPRKFRR